MTENIAEAQYLTKAPGICLVFAGLISILFNFLGAFVYLGHFVNDTMGRSASGREIIGISINVGYYVPWVLLSLLICAGGFQLSRVRARSLVYLAIALCFVPCVTNCWAMIVTVPVGIWAIMVMRNPVVREAYSLQTYRRRR